jgi:hypothetical protein
MILAIDCIQLKCLSVAQGKNYFLTQDQQGLPTLEAKTFLFN